MCSGGTYPLADLFPRNIFAAEQIRYDTGLISKYAYAHTYITHACMRMIIIVINNYNKIYPRPIPMHPSAQARAFTALFRTSESGKGSKTALFKRTATGTAE